MVKVKEEDLLEIAATFSKRLHLKIATIITKNDLSKNLVSFFKSETYFHTHRVADYSVIIAYHLNFTSILRLKIKEVAPFHDFGKIVIPDSILNKPSKLTNEEFEIIQGHSQIGHDLLEGHNNPTLDLAAHVSLQHHERFDGTGYPQGLKGEQISMISRIIAAADVLDALFSKRVYKNAWTDEEILQYFKDQSGKQFDPKIVKIIVDNFEEFRLLSRDLTCSIVKQGGV